MKPAFNLTRCNTFNPLVDADEGALNTGEEREEEKEVGDRESFN